MVVGYYERRNPKQGARVVFSSAPSRFTTLVESSDRSPDAVRFSPTVPSWTKSRDWLQSNSGTPRDLVKSFRSKREQKGSGAAGTSACVKLNRCALPCCSSARSRAAGGAQLQSTQSGEAVASVCWGPRDHSIRKGKAVTYVGVKRTSMHYTECQTPLMMDSRNGWHLSLYILNHIVCKGV